jgi:pre-mRNA-processing factor 19
LFDTAMEDEIGPDGKKIRPGINPVMIDELTECNTMLSAQRKKRQVCVVPHIHC